MHMQLNEPPKNAHSQITTHKYDMHSRSHCIVLLKL